MPERHSLRPNKRRLESEVVGPVAKKQKKHCIGPRRDHSSKFYDSLSTTYLTRDTLRELDERDQLALQSRSRSEFLDSKSVRKDIEHLKSRIPADKYLSYCGLKEFTDIKKTARRGGPDLSDLTGFPLPSSHQDRFMERKMSSSQSSKIKAGSDLNTGDATSTQSKAKSKSPYDLAFRGKLVDSYIYPWNYPILNKLEPSEPENFDAIKTHLSRDRVELPRTGFSLGDHDAFEKFKNSNRYAINEDYIVRLVMPSITGTPEDEMQGVTFSNLCPITHKAVGSIVKGKPDIYHGSEIQRLRLRVRNELSAYIIPSKETTHRMIPNFFVEVKGLDGAARVAGLQACHMGALGARAINKLQHYGQSEITYDKNAYTISCTYSDGKLTMYTVMPIELSTLTLEMPDLIDLEGEPGYVMHRIGTWILDDNIETFRIGVRHYRNGVEWAREQRKQAIDHANKIAAGATATPFVAAPTAASIAAPTVAAVARPISAPLEKANSTGPPLDSQTTMVPSADNTPGKQKRGRDRGSKSLENPNKRVNDGSQSDLADSQSEMWQSQSGESFLDHESGA